MNAVDTLPALLLSLIATFALSACPEDAKRPIGATCGSDEQCVSGLCVSNVCLDPAGDEDGDGLINGLEAALGSNPFDADSDGDGKPDFEELGGSPPRDTDQDGRPDLIESAIADLDGDCVVDELDPDEDGPGELLDGCLNEGVCVSGVALTCDLLQGVPTGCEYGKVAGYMTVEACDGLDNDCDGTTDEGCGVEAITSCDDAFRAELATQNGPYTIDPDGPGAEPSIEVVCAMGMVERGWVRLDPAYEAVLARQPQRLRQYLFLEESGRFAASPWADTPFPWSGRGHLPGAWVMGVGESRDLLGTFACETTPSEDGVGFGCFAGQGVSVSRVIDRQAAKVELCGRQLEGWTGCATATVYVRDAGCAASRLNAISDPGFDELVAGRETCWRIESFEGELDKLGANVFGDFDDAPSEQAPSIRAEPYVPAAGFPWFVSLVQDDLLLIKGVHYRLSFWARASAFRLLMVELGADFVEVLPVGDVWRQLEIDFVPETTTTWGSVRFFLADLADTEETLWLDGVMLLEGRFGACERGSELIANGGFDAGLACWERLRSLEDASQTLGTDGDAPVNAPSARAVPARNDDSEGGTPSLSQSGIPLVAGRSYRLSFSAKTSEARSLRLTVFDESGAGLFLEEDVMLTTSWAPHRFDFEVPSGGVLGTARLMVLFGHPSLAPVWIDDISLTAPVR